MADLLQPKKINYLEGLRGIAALMVLAHHFMLAFYPAMYDGNPNREHMGDSECWYYGSPINVLTNGNFCVTIFFVLSGFVLSHKYIREGKFDIILSAAKRRFFRLFIPVGFVIIIAFLLLHFNMYKHMEVSKISNSEWWLGTLWPIPGTFGWFAEFFTWRVMFDGDSNCDTSMWTMSMELYGSFLVFGLLAISHVTKRRNLICMVALIILFLAHKFYYLAFPLGMMLYKVEEMAAKYKSILITVVLPFILLSLGLLLGSYPSINFAHYSWWDWIYDFKNGKEFLDTFGYVYIHVAGSVLVVTAVILSPLLQKILGSRIFIFLGLISFSLYLLHPLVLGAVSCPIFLNYQESMGYNKAALIALIALVVVTIGISYLMAITVDRFSLNFTKKYFGNASDRKKLAPVKVPSQSLEPAEEKIKRKKKKR